MIMDRPYSYKLPVIRLPNSKQTACEACPGNLVANATIGECWCPRGDLVFNKYFDNCEYLLFFILIYFSYHSGFEGGTKYNPCW